MASLFESLPSIRRPRAIARRYLPVGLSFAIGAALSVAAAAIVWTWEHNTKQALVARRTDNLAVALQRHIDEYIQVTQALGNFYDAADEINLQDFQEFSRPFLERYPGIFTMAWAQFVLQSERAAYEQSIEAEGFFSNFTITESNEQGEFVTAPERSQYFPITYGNPFEPYRTTLGFDLRSDPRVFSAVEKGRDTGKIAASPGFYLLVKATKGLALHRPVYRPGLPKDSLATRRQSFLGSAYTVYQLPIMVREAIEELNLKYLDFYLRDASAPVENSFLLFYDSASQEFIENEELAKKNESKLSEFCREASNCSRKLLVADRQWLLLIRPQPRFVGKRWETEATLAIGLLLSSMVAIYLALSIRRTLDLEAAMEQLQKTQLQLLQVEKMSSLGELVAGVAHEINNPTSFIYGNIDHTSEYIKNLLELLELYREQYPEPSEEIEEMAEDIELDFIKQDLPKTLASMKSGAERIKNIVLSLRTFSHMDESDLKTVQIHQGIDSTLMILQSRLNPTAGHEEIAVVKEYGDLPPVECYAGQLNHVFLNIITTGIDAIQQRLSEQQKKPETETETEREKSGFIAPEIRIRTEAIPGQTPEDAGRVAIKIADNGVGIKKENIDRVFNPFFTTKPVGSGTGLGLSISYKIIAEKHKGNLECLSEPGKGTEFVIKIPVKQTV